MSASPQADRRPCRSAAFGNDSMSASLCEPLESHLAVRFPVRHGRKPAAASRQFLLAFVDCFPSSILISLNLSAEDLTGDHRISLRAHELIGSAMQMTLILAVYSSIRGWPSPSANTPTSTLRTRKVRGRRSVVYGLVSSKCLGTTVNADRSSPKRNAFYVKAAPANPILFRRIASLRLIFFIVGL